MKTRNNPLPFYQLEGDIWTNYKPLWHNNNAHCENTCCYTNAFYVGSHWFQHKVSASTTNIVSVKLRNVSDNNEVAATIGHTLYSFGADRFVVISLDIVSGLIGSNYYLAIETNNEKFYSEIFCVQDNLSNRVAIAWASDCRIGDLVYNDSIRNLVNLDAIVIPSEPELISEVVENGEGDETPTFQKLKQKYTFSCVVPNFLGRALSALPLHNRFNIVDRFGGETYSNVFDEDIKEVTVQVTPEDDGCNSFVEIVYVKETVVKTGCCDGVLSELITEFTIWNENVGQPNEYDVTTVPEGTDLEYAIDPYNGSVCMSIPAQGDFALNLILEHEVGVSFNEDGELSLWLKTTDDWLDPSAFMVFWLMDGLGNYSQVMLDTTALLGYGFDNTIHDTWQNLLIPMSIFDYASSSIKLLFIGFIKNPAVFMDLIEYNAFPES